MFKFKLTESVTILLTTRQGTIEARADYTEYSNQYLVRYINGVGDSTDSWFNESQLEKVSV